MIGFWEPVSSANLLQVRYREKARRMDVIFHADPGLVYTYEDVDLADYVTITSASSVGAEFNRRIRAEPQRHPYRRRRIA